MDCQHWIPLTLELETKERKALEYENRLLRSRLADIAELAKGVERPQDDWTRFTNACASEIMRIQQAQTGSMRPQQSIFGSLLGGICPPYF